MSTDPTGDSSPSGEQPSADTVAIWTLIRDPRLISIMLLSGVGILSTQAVVPALPEIQSGLSVTDARIGLVLSTFFLPSVIGIPLAGAVCDIYGRRSVALISLTGFGLAGVGMTLAPTFEVLLALRVVQGICFAGLTPLSVAFVGDFFQGAAGTTAQGIRLSTNGIVVILAPAIAGVLAETAWNYPFLLFGAAFPALIVVYNYFPTSQSAADPPKGSITEAFRDWIRGLIESLDNRGVLVLILGGSLLFAVRYTMLTLAPLLASRTIGLSPSTIGMTLSLLGVVRVLVSPQAGWFATRLSRKPALLVSMGLVGGSMSLFAVADSLSVFVSAIIVYSVGFSLFNPTLNDAVATSAPAETRGGVVSTMSAAKSLANTAGPAAAGVLLVMTNFKTVFVVALVVALLYVLVLGLTLESEGC